MHTAQHLVRHCFSSDLALGRTFILVTHHIALCLPVASYLIELDKGTVMYQGTIPELEENGHLFQIIKNEDEPFSSFDRPTEETLDGDDATTSTLAQRPVPTTDGKLVEAEARAEGRVSLHSYVTYIKASGILGLSLTIIFSMLIRGINIGNQVNHFPRAQAVSLFNLIILCRSFSFLPGLKLMKKSIRASISLTTKYHFRGMTYRRPKLTLSRG